MIGQYPCPNGAIMLFSAELIHSINTPHPPPFNNTRITVCTTVRVNSQTLQDYHAYCLPFLSSAPPTRSLLPNSTPQTAHFSHTSTPSFRYGTSFLCSTEPSVRNTLALYEASTLKAEWADMRISGQFILDWEEYLHRLE